MKRNLLFLILCFISVSWAIAQVPQTLSYQGLLTDASGNPLSGTHSVLFNFYTVSTGGTITFARGPLSVTTFQGLFTVVLGNGQGSNNAGLPNLGSAQYYIGIVADGGTELSPRVALTAVPYAYTASALDANATVPGSQIGTGVSATNITTGMLSGSLVNITNINGANITSGTVGDSQLASSGISASKITTGKLPLAQFMTSSTSAPTSPVAGALWFNQTDNMLEYYNGTNWYYTTPKVAWVETSIANGTSDKTLTGAAWTQRDLSIVTGDPIVTLASNQMTLNTGEYLIEVSAPCFNCQRHKTKLVNVVTSATYYGSSEYNYSGSYQTTPSTLIAKVSLTSSASFIVKTWNQGGGQGGQSDAIIDSENGNLAVPEIYTRVKITKLR